MSAPLVSFILATHNRRDVVLSTLARVEACGLRSPDRETLVVDNHSSDGTAESITRRFPNVRVLARTDNLGSCAKGLAVDLASGAYLVFLDDDSYPRPGSLLRMIDHFERNPRLGAAGFLVHLPDGGMECSALPNVFIGCGVGLRTKAIREVGGLDLGLFMQAEEYDLSFRLIDGGWDVETFSDLHVDHLKTPQARVTARTTYYDTRNNLLLISRYLPSRFRRFYRQDWTQRYGWLAERHGHDGPFRKACAAAWWRGWKDRLSQRRRRLDDPAFETLFRFNEISQHLTRLADTGVRQVLFADLGKNMFPFYCGAQRAGLSVNGIIDDRFASARRSYRGLPILSSEAATGCKVDAVVVSNTSPVHAAYTRERMERERTEAVWCWYGHSRAVMGGEFPSTCPADPADSPQETPRSASRQACVAAPGE